MADAPNFSALLDRPSNSVERPKPLPAGTYQCIIKGQPRFDQSSKKKTDFVEFTLGIQAALDDVDEDELKAWMSKKDGTSRTLTDATLRATYYLTEDALWRLAEFLNHAQAGDESDPIKVRISEAPNCTLLAVVGHRASEDGESQFAELKKTGQAD